MRILIAEDDPISRRLLEAHLCRWGHEVILARDGAEAWQALQQPEAPQLVILDWMMPKMDGLEVCRAVREQKTNGYTYVILLTAKGQKRHIAEGMEAGADDYLTKPFDAQELHARLRAGQRILDLEAELLAALKTLRHEATHDALTRLWNHSAILDILRGELSRTERGHAPMGIILADLDHFKQINDAHGHLVGDAVLREVSRRMRCSVRTYDQVGRYGGEEFLVVLPGCGANDAMMIAERLRKSVEGEAVETEGGTLAVTLSLGVSASASGSAIGVSALLRAADTALYRAKDRGRNRIEAADLRDIIEECKPGTARLPELPAGEMVPR